MNVAIVGLFNDTNIGDAIICESVKYICKQIAPHHEYIIFDLKGRKNGDMSFRVVSFINRTINSVRRHIFKRKNLFNIGFLRFNNILKKELKNIDFVIIAGGGVIECEHYSCNFYLNQITKFAVKHNIKIVYNAVGFNGTFCENNSGYQTLKRILNSDNVINVSVRENLDEMNNKYLVNKTALLVADSAVWSADCYNQKKKDDSKLIGINLIRPNIFGEFGYNDSEDAIYSFYTSIIKKLENDDYHWQFFTNGSNADYCFGLKILTKMRITPTAQVIQNRPKDGKSFLSILSNYKGIICFRMHASICSYSLGIPSVAIEWNPKQKFFYQNIGYPERCMRLNLGVDFIYDTFAKSLIEGFEENYMSSFKQTEIDYLNSVLNK